MSLLAIPVKLEQKRGISPPRVQPVARLAMLSKVIPRPGQLPGQLLDTWRADRDGNGGAPDSDSYRRTRKNYGVDVSPRRALYGSMDE